MGGDVTRVGQARSLGSDRAKLRLSRGLPVGLAPRRHPTDSRTVNDSKDQSWGCDVTRVGQAGSPGSDGASPYLSRRLPPVNLPYKLAPLFEPFRARVITVFYGVSKVISVHIPEERRILGKPCGKDRD